MMTPEEQDAFEWSYSLCRIDVAGAPPIQFFQRVAHAKVAMQLLHEAYPDIPLGIFVRGDQLYLGHPEIHESVH